MYTLCFHKLVFWIVMESHEMERGHSFVGSTWGEEEKSEAEGRAAWLEAKTGWPSARGRAAFDFLGLSRKRGEACSEVSAPSLVVLSL